MAFKFFLLTGIVDPVHPSGFIMFASILGVSLVMKKGFCGWICPVGTLSQYIWMAGEKIFGRNFSIGPFTDISLRSIKYVLLVMFLFLIGIAMPTTMMALFFIADYYKIVDVRMLKFFTEMSTVTLVVLLSLGALSLLYKNFWCRYLCPYGALLGLLSRLSPFKVRRNEEKCIHCHACTKHCPALIDVEKKEVVKSGECFGCLTRRGRTRGFAPTSSEPRSHIIQQLAHHHCRRQLGIVPDPLPHVAEIQGIAGREERLQEQVPVLGRGVRVVRERHGDLVHDLVSTRDASRPGDEVQCVHCHVTVGHGALVRKRLGYRVQLRAVRDHALPPAPAGVLAVAGL